MSSKVQWFFWVSLSIFSACGVKGPPLPPLEVLPQKKDEASLPLPTASEKPPAPFVSH